MKAIVSTRSRDYLHAVTDDGLRVFVHQKQADFLIPDAAIGDVLDCQDIYETEKGWRATFTTWIDHPA